MITTQIQGAAGLIKVEGRLTFQEYDVFKAGTKEILEGHWITEIDLDLSGATHLDSNALSMLLALRERSLAKNITLKLLNPSANIRTLFEMVQFDQLFLIVE